MNNEISESRQAGVSETSVGGMLLLLLACLPYFLLVGVLPEAGAFPNQASGEARLDWGLQQALAYFACGATLVLPWLALWRASRSGGIAAWARRTLPALVAVSCIAMVGAISRLFDEPGPWLPLVPILLPPAIGVYALWGCCPARRQWLPPRGTEGAAVGAIAVLSIAFIPLGLLDAASYPRRLEIHRAELAAADAAAKAAGAQYDVENRAKFARLGPDSSLGDYLAAGDWYLSGVDILAGARQVKSRQSDAIAMLDARKILDLYDLWQLDLDPNPALCAAYGRALSAKFGRAETGWGSVLLDQLRMQYPNMRWLHDAHCDLNEPVAEIDARLGWMLESKDPSGARPDDGAAYYSRFGVNRDAVQAMRVELAGFLAAR